MHKIVAAIFSFLFLTWASFSWWGCSSCSSDELFTVEDDAGKTHGDGGPWSTECASTNDCHDDKYCANGQCLSFGVSPAPGADPRCLRVLPPGVFAPTMQCEWRGPEANDPYPNHKNVLSTPVVAALIPGVDISAPLIIFTSYDRLDGGAEASRCDNGAFGVIRIINGKDCKLVASVENIKVRPSSPLAIADLTADGKPEIIAYKCGGGLVAITYNQQANKFEQLWSSSSTMAINDEMYSGPSVFGLDDDTATHPKIFMGGVTFDRHGNLLDDSIGLVQDFRGTFGVAADVDNDGRAEYVNGQSVYEWDFSTKKWKVQFQNANTAGNVAVADLGTYGASADADVRSKLDGVAEIIVVHAGTVRAQTVDGRIIFGPVAMPGGGRGGAPTAADFDGDGQVEIACAGQGHYSIFDPDCEGPTPSAAQCPSLRTDGVLWSQVSQDFSSSTSGSSVFDFEGDGKAEAIYADECFARVYEGSTGEVLFSQHHTSCTWFENPIVADVDGDFKSELVIPSNLNCDTFTSCAQNAAMDKSPSGKTMDPLFKGFRCKENADCLSNNCNTGFCRCADNSQCDNANGYECAIAVSGTPGAGNVCRAVMPEGSTGIRVYNDQQDRWVNSRPIWNQHAYSVTNVSDSGSVPLLSKWTKNWTTVGLNNFRQNKPGTPEPTGSVADLTVQAAQIVSCAGGVMKIETQICNRGTKAISAGVPFAVYLGDPLAGGKLGCSGLTTKNLAIETCEKVSCDISPLPTASVDLYIVVDDDGTSKNKNTECYKDNNWSKRANASCIN